jgi:MOSC domain-containing protein YiiM
MEGKILAVCRSEKKGTVKEEISTGRLIEGYGLEGDAHGGDWHRQISLLDNKSIEKMRGKGYELNFGDFAENITTEGMILHKLPVGSQLNIGQDIILEITQIGKKCHQDCEIAQKIGKCVMPKEGVFARIITGGEIKSGDKIKFVS